MTKLTLLLAAVALPAVAFSAVERNGTGTNLSDSASWTSGVAPTASDIALFDSASAVAATSNLVDTNLSWAGLQVTNTTATLSIGNASANTLTIGASGIDMSAATQNAYLNNNLNFTGNQTWTVAGGRTLGIATNTAENGFRNMSGTSDINLVQSGTGVATVKVFSSGTNTHTGNWAVGNNVELQFIRNFQTGLGAGTVTLANGSIFAQTQGSWANSNAIVLGATAGDVATIGNRSSNSQQRVLKLNGVLSGPGGVIFNNYIGGAMTNAGSASFMLTNANTFTGPMTINSGAIVRIGGNNTNDASGGNLGATTTGSIQSSVAVTNNGILVFGRSDSVVFANTITGTGAVNIGGQTGTLISGANTQVITLTGANSHAATNVAQGTLITGNISALGSGGVTVGAGTLQIGDGTTNSVTLGSGANLAIAAGATLKFFAADSAIALQGAGSYTLGNSTIDLNGLFNAAGTYNLISGGNVAGGTQGTLTFSNFDNTNFTASFSGGQLVVSAVPEPSVYGLLGAGALAAGAWVRRRRNSGAK